MRFKRVVEIRGYSVDLYENYQKRKVASKPKLAAKFSLEWIATWATSSRPQSNFAQIASALVAIIALIGIYVQVSLTRTNALKANARQVYVNYSAAALKYPQLARPNYQKLKEARDQTELVRYQIYVGHMLSAFDEILALDDEPEWLASFRYDIQDHLTYLCELNDLTFFATFYNKTILLLNEEKNKYCPEIAASNLSQIGAPMYVSPVDLGD